MLPDTGYINYIFILGIVLALLIVLRVIFVVMKRRKEGEE